MGRILERVGSTYRIGRGNGSRPAIWTVISTAFVYAPRSKDFGALLAAPFIKLDVDLASIGLQMTLAFYKRVCPMMIIGILLRSYNQQ